MIDYDKVMLQKELDLIREALIKPLLYALDEMEHGNLMSNAERITEEINSALAHAEAIVRDMKELRAAEEANDD
ncbi:hypothetical protein LCGC14_0387170 [marine sediment metagenome]|uniref:Uncharacterized protein n=1 Tax=marine sediment metagenome TaxID=412755 RepID=A0A0F9T6K7_9ZZZZ